MALKRMDKVLLLVDDLEAVKALFLEPGLELEGEATVAGPEVGRLIGLQDVRATLAMLRTPDGQGIELEKFHTPEPVRMGPVDAPVNALGYRRGPEGCEAMRSGMSAFSLPASLALLAWAGCNFLPEPSERWEYRIAFEDSVLVSVVGDTTRIHLSTNPYMPEEYGLRKAVTSLDPEIIRVDSNRRAIALGFGKTRLVAALLDGDGKAVAADTLLATVPVARVMTRYFDGGCVRLQIVKSAAQGTMYFVRNGLYKSTDGGLTWDSLRTGALAFHPSGTLVENPFQTRELYWTQPHHPLLRTRDGGITWDTALSDYGSRIEGLVFHPRVPNTLFIFATERDTLHLFKSGDGGSSFVKLSRLTMYYTPPPTLLFDPQDDRLLYLSPSTYRSRDGGLTWETTPFKIEGLSMYHFQLDGRGRLYAFHRALLRSDDHGETWETLFSPTEPDMTVYDLDVPESAAGPLAFFRPATKSIYYSDNDGYAWNSYSFHRFSPNSCSEGGVLLIRDSPQEFLVSDGQLTWRYRPVGN